MDNKLTRDPKTAVKTLAGNGRGIADIAEPGLQHAPLAGTSKDAKVALNATGVKVNPPAPPPPGWTHDKSNLK